MIGSALHTYAKQLLSASSNISQTEKISSLKINLKKRVREREREGERQSNSDQIRG